MERLFTINGNTFSTYHAEPQIPRITGVDLNTEYMAERQMPMLLKQRQGLKRIELPVTFRGSSSANAYQFYSMFCKEATGMVTLQLHDGRYYYGFLEGSIAEEYVTEGIMDATFNFLATKRDTMTTRTGNASNAIQNPGDLPETDCIITVTVGASGTNYNVHGVVFDSVSAGDVLVVDGIDGRILINNVPAAEHATFTKFPTLVPQWNTIQCVDTVSVSFYPGYF